MPTITVEIPRAQIKEIASRMLQELPVDDLDISEIPVEDSCSLVTIATPREENGTLQVV